VEAARAAGEAGAEVTLFSAEAVWPYFRPRLVMVAFRESDPDSITMHPPEWYASRNVTVRLATPVEGFDASALSVRADGREERFDAVVLTTGSVPVLPPFAAGAPERITALWNMEHAVEIRQRLVAGGRMIVVGGGILGIETALRAALFGMDVTLVELSDRLMPVHLGRRAAAVLLKHLRQRRVAVELGRRVVSAQAVDAGGKARLTLDGGKALDADWCVVTIGARPALSVGAQAGLARDRGVKVDEFMRTSAANVWAAGDVAQLGGTVRCSVREATAKGKAAGTNALAALEGKALTPFMPVAAPVSLKARDFEIHALGEPGAGETEEVWLAGSSDEVVRSLLVKDGVAVGVQMVGTREGFDALAGQLGRKVDAGGGSKG
jgi:NAD(P)H-nitrite reductase large subunit